MRTWLLAFSNPLVGNPSAFSTTVRIPAGSACQANIDSRRPSFDGHLTELVRAAYHRVLSLELQLARGSRPKMRPAFQSSHWGTFVLSRTSESLLFVMGRQLSA